MKISTYTLLLLLGSLPLEASQAVSRRLIQTTACALEEFPKPSLLSKASACLPFCGKSAQAKERARVEDERIGRFNQHQTFFQALTDLTNLPPEIIAIVALYNQATFLLGNRIESTACSVEALSPERIAVGCADGSIVLVDITEGKIVQTLQGHKAPVYGLYFFKDRHELLSLSTLDGYNVSDLHFAWINGRPPSVRAAALEQKKKAKECDDVLRVWSTCADNASQSASEESDSMALVQEYAPNQQCKNEAETKITGEVGELRRSGAEVAIARERSWISTISQSLIPIVGYAQVSDVMSYWSLDKEKKFPKGMVTSLPVTAVEGQVFIGWSTGEILVLNQKTETPVAYLRGHTAPVRILDFLDKDNKRYLFSGSDDGTIRVWDRDTKQELQTLIGHTAPISALKISFFSKDALYLVSVAADGTVRKWSLDII